MLWQIDIKGAMISAMNEYRDEICKATWELLEAMIKLKESETVQEMLENADNLRSCWDRFETLNQLFGFVEGFLD